PGRNTNPSSKWRVFIAILNFFLVLLQPGGRIDCDTVAGFFLQPLPDSVTRFLITRMSGSDFDYAALFLQLDTFRTALELCSVNATYREGNANSHSDPVS